MLASMSPPPPALLASGSAMAPWPQGVTPGYTLETARRHRVPMRPGRYWFRALPDAAKPPQGTLMACSARAEVGAGRPGPREEPHPLAALLRLPARRYQPLPLAASGVTETEDARAIFAWGPQGLGGLCNKRRRPTHLLCGRPKLAGWP